MRPEILKFCFAQIQRATKFRHANKPYRCKFYIFKIPVLLSL